MTIGLTGQTDRVRCGWRCTVSRPSRGRFHICYCGRDFCGGGRMRAFVRIGLASIGDRKSTRLNSSHGYISYAVFCLKTKKRQARESVHVGITAGECAARILNRSRQTEGAAPACTARSAPAARPFVEQFWEGTFPCPL